MADIILTWTPPSEQNGGSADQYQIWKREGQHTSPSTIVAGAESGWNPKTINHSGSATSSQTTTDDDADFGKYYSYTIKAKNAAGSSADYSTPDNAKA
jgi:hypothetical protein